MAVKLWGFAIGADSSPAQREFGKIPVFASKAGKDAGKGMKKGMEQGLGPIGKILGGLSPALAPVVERVNKLSSGVAGVGGGAATAAIAIGGVGIAAVGAAAAVVGLVHHAATLTATLKPFADRGLLPAESIKGVRDADAAMMSVVRVGQAAEVVMASKLAPSVERVSVDLVALGLYGLDALGGIQGAAREAAIWLGDKLVKGLTGPVYFLRQLASGVVLVSEALGKNMGPVKDAIKSYDDWTRSISSTAVDYYAGSIRDAETAGASYIDRARAIVSLQGQIADKTMNATKALKGQKEATIELVEVQNTWADSWGELDKMETEASTALLTPQQRITAELDAQLVRVQALGEASGDYDTAAQVSADIRAKSARDLADLEIAERQRVASATAAIGGQVLSGVQSLAQARVSAEGNAASGAVAIQKGAAILQIGIAAKQAFAEALTLGFPLGPIFGAALAGLALAQAAQVAATPVPSYATGYTPSRMGEGLAYVDQQREAVLSSRAVRTIGTDTIRDAQNGRGSSPVVDVSLDGSTVAAVATRRTVSSTRNAARIRRVVDSGRIGTTGQSWR